MENVEGRVNREICHYWRECEPRCDGYHNCMEYETTKEVMHRKKAEKRLKVKADIQKALNNRKLVEIYTCIMHYAMRGETED